MWYGKERLVCTRCNKNNSHKSCIKSSGIRMRTITRARRRPLTIQASAYHLWCIRMLVPEYLSKCSESFFAKNVCVSVDTNLKQASSSAVVVARFEGLQICQS